MARAICENQKAKITDEFTIYDLRFTQSDSFSQWLCNLEMSAAIQNSKAALREKIRAGLKNVSQEKQKFDSEMLCAKLKEQRFFRAANSILFFAPLSNEVNIWPLLSKTIAESKVVALPCYDADAQDYKSRRVKNIHVEIISGQFGIREPAIGCIEIPLDDLDLVLVPGVAFDLNGHRLGRGKGFYDRLLQNFRGAKCGIAFEEQIVEKIPSEKTDVHMDFILTPTRCVEIKQISDVADP